MSGNFTGASLAKATSPLVLNTDCQYSSFFDPMFCVLPFQIITCFIRTKMNSFPSSYCSIIIFTRRKEILILFSHFQFKLVLLRAVMKYNEKTEQKLIFCQSSANWFKWPWAIDKAATRKYSTENYSFSSSTLQSWTIFFVLSLLIFVDLIWDSTEIFWYTTLRFLQVNAELWHGCKMLVSLPSSKYTYMTSHFPSLPACKH